MKNALASLHWRRCMLAGNASVEFYGVIDLAKCHVLPHRRSMSRILAAHTIQPWS